MSTMQDEQVIRAELRLHKGMPAREFAPAREGDAFLIRLYQLKNGTTTEEDRLDTIEIRYSDEGWVILDVTEAVRDWQRDYRTNLVRESTNGYDDVFLDFFGANLEGDSATNIRFFSGATNSPCGFCAVE